MTRAELIALILREIKPTRDPEQFRAWLESLPEFQLKNWADALEV